MTALFTLISNLVSGKFHGELTIEFRSGKIYSVHQLQSLDVKQFE